MKTIKLFFGLILTSAVLFQSCTQTDESIDSIVIEGDIINNDNGGGTPPPANNNDVVILQGSITTDLTLESAKTYELKGGVTVESGATLTVQAGTKIIAGSESGVFAFLLIAQGAKIQAIGTASQPIVFTSKNATPNAGDWGGLLLAGKAPINRGLTATSEVANATYGGTDPLDNSGTLSYVRLEFTGGKINADAEFNGLSLYGVGSGTTIDHVQVFQGNDDGFEFFGGSVNTKYLVSVGAKDDLFDWTDGWIGKNQFWVGLQTSIEGDRGFEGDNLSSNRLATPVSSPTIANVTIVGAEDGDGGNQAMKLREGTQAKIYNTIAKGFSRRGVQVEHDETITQLNDGKITVEWSIIDNVNPFVYTGTAVTATVDFANPSFNNSSAPVTLSQSVFGTFPSGFNPSTLDPFFSSAAFIGGVSADDNWMAGWVRF